MRVFVHVAVALVGAVCVLAAPPPPVCMVERLGDGAVVTQACPGDLECGLGPTEVQFQDEALEVSFCVQPDAENVPIPLMPVSH